MTSRPHTKGRIFLGYSSMPGDHVANGVRDFEKLHADHGLDYRHSTAQISAFVAAKVLVEGLKRAGRNLSCERPVSELEDRRGGELAPIDEVSEQIRAYLGRLKLQSEVATLVATLRDEGDVEIFLDM